MNTNKFFMCINMLPYGVHVQYGKKLGLCALMCILKNLYSAFYII